MTIDELIMNGASEDEIAKALAEAKMAKAKKDAEEAKRAKANEKEALKAEGRAYLINALMAYSTAFGLLPVDYEMSQEELDETEELIKQIEELIPLYIKMAGLDKKIEKILKGEEIEDSDDDIFGNFFKGLGM